MSGARPIVGQKVNIETVGDNVEVSSNTKIAKQMSTKPFKEYKWADDDFSSDSEPETYQDTVNNTIKTVSAVIDGSTFSARGKQVTVAKSIIIGRLGDKSTPQP